VCQGALSIRDAVSVSMKGHDGSPANAQTMHAEEKPREELIGEAMANEDQGRGLRTSVGGTISHMALKRGCASPMPQTFPL